MRFKLDGSKILENGHHVATLTEMDNTDTAGRLVSLLNLADRDETMLDDLGKAIARRNEVV
jgi:aminoglycoside phosphotransferase family enzyme